MFNALYSLLKFTLFLFLLTSLFWQRCSNSLFNQSNLYVVRLELTVR
jgi:hypothetical protein